MEGQLPGGAGLGAMRRQAIGRFAALGLPSRRVEEWKYTDLRSGVKEAFALLPDPGAGPAEMSADIESLVGAAAPAVLFVDGHGAGQHGNAPPAGVRVEFLAQAAGALPGWAQDLVMAEVMREGAAVALNSALFTDGAVIDVPEGVELATPIFIVSGARHGGPGLTAMRHLIRIGKGAKATIVELDRSGRLNHRQASSLTQIILGDGADLAHVKLVDTRQGSVHLGHWHASLGKDARYQPFQLTLGEGLARHGLDVDFLGERTTFDFSGASIVHGDGHADTTLEIDHQVPHCTSRELFKAVLDGRARAVFQGKVIVRPGAQKTDGKQMAQALMLSPEAEFDSKPELEIYADDVVCGHGSTAAEIDPDLVFYCTSRGIPPAEARALLIWSFVAEAIEKVEDDHVRGVLEGLARASLGLE